MSAQVYESDICVVGNGAVGRAAGAGAVGLEGHGVKSVTGAGAAF
jgi:hypothetical protein